MTAAESHSTTHPERILDRSAFLSRGNDRRTKIVEIPGLGSVKIRSLKESERSEFEADTFDDDGEFTHEALLTAKRRLVILCVVDVHCEPLLTMQDLDALGSKDGAIFSALYKECAAFSGITETDLAALVGNSKPIPGDASP